MENLNVNINGDLAMDIITTLKKMNIFDDIMEIGVKSNDNQRKMNNINAKILKKIENYSNLNTPEEKEKVVKETFENNPILKNEYENLQRDIESQGAKLVSKIVMALPTAREEVWKVLASATGKTKEEVRNLKLPQIIKIIKSIFKSEDIKDLMAFFN